MKDIQFQQMLKGNKHFVQSEIYHNICTNLLIKFTEESVLLSQLIENYKKYYSKVFKIITEEEESQTCSNLINSGGKFKEKGKFSRDFQSGILMNTQSIPSINENVLPLEQFEQVLDLQAFRGGQGKKVPESGKPFKETIKKKRVKLSQNCFSKRKTKKLIKIIKAEEE